jgi:hypothetical protein
VGSDIWSFLCGHLNFCAGSTKKTSILPKVGMRKLQNKCHFYANKTDYIAFFKKWNYILTA